MARPHGPAILRAESTSEVYWCMEVHWVGGGPSSRVFGALLRRGLAGGLHGLVERRVEAVHVPVTALRFVTTKQAGQPRAGLQHLSHRTLEVGSPILGPIAPPQAF